MKLKAIIFDLDGTIVHTENIWRQATKILIERRGIEYDGALKKELTVALHGAGTTKSCHLIKLLTNIPDEVETLIQEKTAIAASLYNNITFISGFTTFQAAAAKARVPMAIATNANNSTIKTTDQIVNLTALFGEHIYGIESVFNRAKPDPAVYLHAANRLGVNPEECVAFEDSAHGIAAAKAAGMYCIGINSHDLPESLSAADRIINSYEELHTAESFLSKF